MELQGLVTNVTEFGAFVDIGVHQDGLVHLSEISHTFVKSPSEVLSVGQAVKVKVLTVDLQAKRIGLSIKALTGGPGGPAVRRPAPHRPRPEQRTPAPRREGAPRAQARAQNAGREPQDRRAQADRWPPAPREPQAR